MDGKKLAGLLVTLAAIGVAGCTSTGARSGPVVGHVVPFAQTLVVGSRVPDITFADPDGKVQRISSFYRDATILAIIEQPCASRNSDLVAASAALKGRVSVIEVTSPPGGCQAHEACVMRRGDSATHMISLCDGAGLVRRWFGVTTPNAVFVINRRGEAVALGTLADLPRLREKAAALNREARGEDLETYD